MDPAYELSVRVVSHLWVLRHAFPVSSGVADLPEDWTARLADLAAEDFSIDRRLREFAAGEGDPEQAERPIERFVEQLREITQTEEEEHDRFPVAELIFRRYAGEPERDVLTRGEITDRICNLMLDREPLMLHVSNALNYIPMLVRLIGTPEGWTNLDALREAADYKSIPIPFSMAFREELAEIDASRQERLGLLIEANDRQAGPVPELPGNRPGRRLAKQRAYDRCMAGVAISGGGIRSATFALGLLQSMADARMLPFLDYLSTVSGGGYIGSWMQAWAKRRGSIHSVQDSMRGYASDLPCTNGCTEEERHGPDVARNSDPMNDDVRPIRYLREYSRYLAPLAGFLSADSWTIFATWLRNTALNLLVLVLALSSILLLPRSAAWLLLRLPGSDYSLGLAAAVVLWAACWIIGRRNLDSFAAARATGGGVHRGDTETLVVFSIGILIVAASFLAVAALWTQTANSAPAWQIAAAAGAVYAVGAIIVAGRNRTSGGVGPVSVGLTGLVGGGLVAGLGKVFARWMSDSQLGTWLVVTVGLILFLGILCATVTLLIGLMGRDLPEEQREWWSRLGAWIAIFMGAWLVTGAVCFFAPYWVAKMGAKLAIAGLPWAAITGIGVKFAYDPKSGRDRDTPQNPVRVAVMLLAPYVFVAGMLIGVAFWLNYGLGRVLESETLAKFFLAGNQQWAHILCCTGASFSFQRMVDNYWTLMYPASWLPVAAAVVLAALAVMLSTRVDVNEFSMHNFYRNRLTRAYLGASRMRQHRRPNAFTGFDDLADDLPLSRLRRSDPSRPEDKLTDCQRSFIGPLSIMNAALNISRGADLGSQERKAESFYFTPLRAGFDFTRKQTYSPEIALQEYAIRPTMGYASGITVGTAAAISGAAANPNAGFHTTPALAFLLTTFNVRLGRWLGNPRQETWRRASPQMGLTYLLAELTGHATTRSGYVQLSDGGHFDNMGLYELVRRRCRFIVVIDGEEDGAFKLEGIGGAIRKCRVDFGAVIRLDVRELEPSEKTTFSRVHHTVGTILYPGEPECGVIVYIKSSLTGDEPLDVVEFRKRVAAFPHESTGNQFFDESHFESYRRLGHHIGAGVFQKDWLETYRRCGFDLCNTLNEIFCDLLKDSAASRKPARRSRKV